MRMRNEKFKNEKYFFKNESSAQNEATYKRQRNYCTFIFREAKSNY